MKKLPLGIQTFKEIIESGYLYIDKTRKLDELIKSGKHFFISRPRRFGKSLLCSTLAEIFKGNRELFKALYIYDKIDWQEHPVLHLDFSSIDCGDAAELEESLKTFLIDKSSNPERLKGRGLKGVFSALIEELSGLNKAAVIIDEYDKPIIDHITNPDKAAANREVLRSFYSALKANDRYLKFVFLAGVSKFSKVSVFSGLNNLTDITLDNRFAAIAGITQQELESSFDAYINKLAEQMDIPRSQALESIKAWYNGYSWDGKAGLYNPFSILNLFSSFQFRNYWFSSGTPTFLIDTIKNQKVSIEEYENKPIGEEAFDAFDVGRIDVTSLLFQSGYLTVSKVQSSIKGVEYCLTFPNSEVKDALFRYIVASFVQDERGDIKPIVDTLKENLQNADIAGFTGTIKALLAGIPYNLHLPREAYYHSLFYMILSLMGAKIDLEVLTDKGRVDAVLELKDKVFIIEFKLASAEDALKQIEDKKYYEKYLIPGKATCLLGVGGFSEKKVEYRMKTIKR